MLLGAWERPVLAWLAARMPARVTPDRCTALGVGGAAGTAAGYGLSNVSAPRTLAMLRRLAWSSALREQLELDI
jgi:hypothetical protein